MTTREFGLLLLCADFGQQAVRSLSLQQYLHLRQRVTQSQQQGEPDDTLTAAHLHQLGYGAAQAEQILQLLERQEQCEALLRQAQSQGIYPLVWGSPDYPAAWAEKLGQKGPAVVFYRGNLSLLRRPGIALVGSRRLQQTGEVFARRVGQMAARQGLVLISGNAIGADRTAQQACLDAGGSVCCIVADELERYRAAENGPLLYCSDGGFQLPFSAARAYFRNGMIHSLAQASFVAQSGLRQGGTWSGTSENLRHGWSTVYLCDDGSEAMAELEKRGGTRLNWKQLEHVFPLLPEPTSFLF